MLKKKKNASTPPFSSILIPLYVYPNPGAWDPLHKAIKANPNLDFTVIINPDSGPGNGAVPDANYSREIARLNSSPNVRTIGYISTSWTNRKLALVLADIDTYAGWRVLSPSLGISGIFLDETPTVYSETSALFLGYLASTICSEKNFGEDPLVRPPPEGVTPEIIHNPGSIPDTRYMSFCDVSVVFEESFPTYQEIGVSDAIFAFQNAAKVGREAIGCIIHHIPEALTPHETKRLTQDLRYVAAYFTRLTPHLTSNTVVPQVIFFSPVTASTTMPASAPRGSLLLQTWQRHEVTTQMSKVMNSCFEG